MLDMCVKRKQWKKCIGNTRRKNWGQYRAKEQKIGRPRRTWFDDVRQWTMLKNYNEVKRNAEEREA